jgi:hypothetical protein
MHRRSSQDQGQEDPFYLTINKKGFDYTGTLASWTVYNNGSGFCTFEELKDKGVAFRTDDFMSDYTLIEIMRKPGWMMVYSTNWTPVGLGP